ncbi:MAG: dihydroorotate dehydrogenase electron transfer subunit [Mycoplasmataceae bacterium]|nr:dihydroorotate dehydrogenase electron transfer subunit [Mycoplasmataceae bacterium]
MVKTIDCKIIQNRQLNTKVFELTVSCSNTSWIKPGKFFNVKVPGFYLRRPMAVCDYSNKSFTFIYELVGEGTLALSKMQIGESLNILIDLGNYFIYKKQYGVPLLVSGGSGLGPIVCLAREFKKQKINFDFVAGFPTKANVAYIKEIKALCNSAYFCTDDGSYGEKGNVVQIINKHRLNNKYYYACGSTNMLKALSKNNKQGQLSLDERMGCGFGACMGCSIKTKNGNQRICKDGPIFYGEDLLW